MALRKRTKLILVIIGVVVLFIVFFHDFSSERALTKPLGSLYGIRDPEFLRSMDTLLGPSLKDGTKTETILNGEFFPAILTAIKSAEKTITFETYIYWSGQTGKMVTDALCERAHAGVKVHVLLDWVGSGKMEKNYLEQMKKAGIEVEKYHSVPFFSLRKANNRTHRKILVIDGKIAFTGGSGVADHWLGNADSKEHWRDTNFRFEGPVVGQMQATFTDNWLETKGELLHGNHYFPELSPAGTELAQVFKSSPTEGSESTRLMYLLSIAAARESIHMSNAYFVPDDLAIHTMVEAARRGVKIQIIAPGEVTDTHLVRSASRSRWGDLLKAGVEFYEYQPTMFHCKVMVVDRIWSTVGSTNFDNRSFRLNDEVNLNVMDENFARKQIEIFYEDLKKSRQITYEEWKKRPVWTKFKEWAAGLLQHQL